jgi:hypothetical protein
VSAGIKQLLKKEEKKSFFDKNVSDKKIDNMTFGQLSYNLWLVGKMPC